MKLFEFLESSFLSSLYILDISPLSDLGLVKILSQSLGGPFCLVEGDFCLAEALQFYQVPFENCRSYSKAIAVLFRNFSPEAISSRLFPTFSSTSFSVSGFMWNFLIHLDLTLVQGDKNG